MRKQLANHNDPDDRDERGADGWQDLAVANPTFLLERLGSECGDLQFLRELTVNGLDAIAAQPDPARGRVVWDLDWQRLEASGGRVRKLTVTDTGTGMTPDQLGRYINQLASSSREQSHTANFGVGAKVAAGSRNPHGLEYRSWHHGHGALVRFKRHRDGRWGLEPQPWPDGHHDYWRPLDEQDKPWLLRGQDHGTQVVLLGRHERDDTTQAPESVTDARQHWITRYLNSRFRQFPDGIEVLVRDQLGRGQPGQLTRVDGERAHVERRAVCGGTVELSDAVACWWVLDDDHRARRREAGTWTSSGHIVAVTRRRALRPPRPDPRWIRAPAGLRRPLRLRTRRHPPPTPGRTGAPAGQHRPHHAPARPRAAPVDQPPHEHDPEVGRGVAAEAADRADANPVRILLHDGPPPATLVFEYSHQAVTSCARAGALSLSVDHRAQAKARRRISEAGHAPTST